MHPQPYHTEYAAQKTWTSTLVSSLPRPTLLTNEQMEIIAVNQQFCDLFHLADIPEEMAGKKTTLYMPHLGLADMESFKKRVLELYESKAAADNDMFHLKDGRIILRDHRPIFFNEHFIGHLWSYSDETEKIRTNELLKAQKEFYEDVLDNIPADIGVFSAEQRYLFVNKIGIKDPVIREWIIGKTDADYYRLKGKDESLGQLRREMYERIAKEGKEYTWEEKTINAAGEEVYNLRKVKPVYDELGKLKLYIGYGLNITERKLIENKIAQSEQRYRDLFNHSQALVCTHDINGKLLEVNPALCEALEISPEELITKTIGDFLPPEHKDFYGEKYLPDIQHSNIAHGLFTVISTSGKKKYLLYRNVKVEDENKEPFVIAFATDVTEALIAQKELEKAQKTAEENVRSKERFLANMSHEIRTPMNGILGITSLLQKTPIDAEQQNYLDIIEQSAHNLLSIINDIIDFEKINSGKVLLEKIAFDVTDKIELTIKLFRVLSNPDTSIHFINRLGSHFKVIGDPTRLIQILNNLMSNAIKFTHQGEISILAEVDTTSSNMAYIHFCVTDTGIGIDPEYMQRLFQPFIQANPETTRKYGGSGLGLAITKSLVEMQEGRIWVESETQKGSRFHFIIPYEMVKLDELPEKEKSKPVVVNKLGRLRVLLAEDNQINQMLAKRILQFWGFECVIANNGREALDWMEQEQFDLVLMDIQMPEINGIEATIEIRKMADAQKRHVPVVALTANALKGEEEKYFSVGINDYLVKPFTENELYSVIEKVLAR